LIAEYVTFHRLIKLCYGSTFIKEGDRDLDVSELMRLIHVTNAFECMDAVKECATALTNGDLDWAETVQCLELTDTLRDVEGMEDLGVKAGIVLAEHVGPFDELFTPAKDGEYGGGVLGGLKLADTVKVSMLPNIPTVAHIQHEELSSVVDVPSMPGPFSYGVRGPGFLKWSSAQHGQ
jgi:hypothetical protein